MATLIEGKYTSDVVVELESRGYSTETIGIKNSGGSAVTLAEVIGLPLNAAGEIITAANANTARQVVIAYPGYKPAAPQTLPVVIPAGEESVQKFIVVARHAILNRDKLVKQDAANAAYNLDTIEAALKLANSPILLAREPRMQAEQEVF